MNARVGLVVGNFLKRFCTVGWVLTALIALALYADCRLGRVDQFPESQRPVSLVLDYHHPGAIPDGGRRHLTSRIAARQNQKESED